MQTSLILLLVIQIIWGLSYADSICSIKIVKLSQQQIDNSECFSEPIILANVRMRCK
jgi:hypothetical protein